MAIRVVMLKFHAFVTEKDIQYFGDELRKFADKIPYKLKMHCGPSRCVNGETDLDKIAPEVKSPHYMAVWEFPDQKTLESFVADPLHHAFAAGLARNMVEQRYVVNIL